MSEMSVISIDTETTGLDLSHGAKVFLVTICKEDFSRLCWEWDVIPSDPVLGRIPVVIPSDLDEIREEIESADEIVLQNAKFDWHGILDLYKGRMDWWDWDKVHDTITSGHVLASNNPHDLTSMAMQYCSIDIEKYDIRNKEACTKARALCRVNLKGWETASKKRKDMPSATEGAWKYDQWLPRAICAYARSRRHDLIGDFKLHDSGFDREALLDYMEETGRLRVDPFGKPIRKTPDPREYWWWEYSDPRHWWMTVCSNYANGDSESTLHIHKAHMIELRRRGLEKIYRNKLKLNGIAARMEHRGLTISRKRLDFLTCDYKDKAETLGGICLNVAKDRGYDLTLPKSGNNNSLRNFCFGTDVASLRLPHIKVSKESGLPSLDKEALERYELTLPTGSKQLAFIKALKAKRKADTALSYMDSYQRYWLPMAGLNEKHWRILYPSLNPNGTDTLRW
jgi:hypothetical protein